MPEADGRMPDADASPTAGRHAYDAADPVLAQLARWRADNERAGAGVPVPRVSARPAVSVAQVTPHVARHGTTESSGPAGPQPAVPTATASPAPTVAAPTSPRIVPSHRRVTPSADSAPSVRRTAPNGWQPTPQPVPRTTPAGTPAPGNPPAANHHGAPARSTHDVEPDQRFDPARGPRPAARHEAVSQSRAVPRFEPDQRFETEQRFEPDAQTEAVPRYERDQPFEPVPRQAAPVPPRAGPAFSGSGELAVGERFTDPTWYSQNSAPTMQPNRASSAPPAIEARNLHKKFKDTVAVADVSFTVPSGSIVALLGPNGAGKTTTVNMLCTLLRPDGGTAFVAGHEVGRDPAAVRRSIMLTGQFAALDESLTGRENLILFGRLLGLKKNEAKARADELLDHFTLTEAGTKRVGQYSGGMRRRIDIACGLVTSPNVVFLDEPTTGLDPRSRQDVWTLVERLKATGVTTLLTTQYLEEADMLSDNIVVIDHGRVIAEGTSDELKSRTGSAYCDVTPEHAAELPRLVSVLADLLPDPAEQSDNLTVSVPAPDGADTLVEVVQRTTQAQVRLSDVTMRRPSLDEVFLHLTDPNRGRN